MVYNADGSLYYLDQLALLSEIGCPVIVMSRFINLWRRKFEGKDSYVNWAIYYNQHEHNQ